jgi:ABC-type transport system substrate-binding protein
MRNVLSMSKRTLLIGTTLVAAALSTGALAQASKQKSKTVTQVGEGDAVWLNPKTGKLDKSNAKITAAKHQAALAGGAKEIPKSAVLYKQGGKMYMFDPGAATDTTAAENFQDSFNDWANQ